MVTIFIPILLLGTLQRYLNETKWIRRGHPWGFCRMYSLAPTLQFKTSLTKIGQLVRSQWRHKWRHPCSYPKYRDKEEKNSFCQILTQQRLCMCRFTYYYLLKWFQDDMNKIWVKVATKKYFSSLSLYFG